MSAASDFGLFGKSATLDYQSGSTCQFSGRFDIFGTEVDPGEEHFIIHFGSACAGVESNGVCIIGICPP